MNTRLSRLALPLALVLAIGGATGCSSSSEPEKPADEVTQEQVEKEEDVVLSDDEVEVTTDEGTPTDATTDDATTDAPAATDEQTTDEAPAADEGTTPTATTETQRIGEEGIGFVDVPSTWVKFQDVDGNSSIQYCDGTPYTIISLNIFDVSSVPEDQREGFDAEAAANSVWANILNDGAAEEDVHGARVTLAGRDAIQVYAQFPDGSFLVCWLVQDDTGVIHYVAAEGPETTIFDTVGMVESTYQLG